MVFLHGLCCVAPSLAELSSSTLTVIRIDVKGFYDTIKGNNLLYVPGSKAA